MNSEFFKYLQAVIILTDLFLLNGSLYLAYILSIQFIVIAEKELFVAVMFTHISWFILTFLTGTYKRKNLKSTNRFIISTIQVSFFLFVIIFMGLYLADFKLSLLKAFMLFVAFNVGSTIIARLLFFYLRKRYSRNFDIVNKVAIIGYNETALKLAAYLENDFINTELVGFFANNREVSELTPYPVLADLSEAVQKSAEIEVQEIYSTISPEQDDAIYQMMAQSERHCIRFKLVPSLDLFFKKPYHTVFFNDLPVLSPFPDPLDDAGNRFKKRIFDLGISLFACVFILSWLIPLLSLLIFLESGTPILFIQKRTGIRDKPFSCFKFRTMRMHPDKEHIQAIKNDARVTKIGSFLRKTSLDEFPQFINVLIGNMSIVGPRPHMIRHTTEFSQMIDHYMVRQLLKPGITGWAQVNGYRGEITHPEQLEKRISNDLWYLQNWSIGLDFKILFLTATGVFKGDKNAY